MSGVPDQGLASTEDQQLIRESALQFLEEHQPIAELRSLRDGAEPHGYSTKLWAEMSGLGWAGLIIPEEHGGAGLGFQELGVVMEALGRHVVTSPLLSSGVLSASAIALVEGWPTSPDLEGMADGSLRAALAIDESARSSTGRIETAARASGEGFVLNGLKRPVLDGATADRLLVVAKITGTGTDDMVALFRVDPDSAGVSKTLLRWIDGRRAAEIRFEDVRLGADAQIGHPVPEHTFVEGITDRGSTALAAELVGLSARAFALTVDFLMTREQFDRPLASLQALQHRCARMYVEIERSISLVQSALRGLDEGAEDASIAASAAKAMTSKMARRVTEECLQLYGGLGMTEEQDIGLYFKRVRVDSLLLGDATFHTRRFARRSGF